VEVGQTAGVAGDDLAIDDAGSGGEAPCGLVPTSRVELYELAVLVKLHAPAVEFDLMQPPRAAGRDRMQHRVAGSMKGSMARGYHGAHRLLQHGIPNPVAHQFDFLSPMKRATILPIPTASA